MTRRKKRIFLCCFPALLFSLVSGKAQNINALKLRKILLYVVDSARTTSFENIHERNPGCLTAIIFLSTECPICQNYTLVLNGIEKEYGKKVKVLGVFPNDEDSSAACLFFKKKYKTEFPLFRDPTHGLVDLLGATITPEVYLIDADRNLVIYHGAVDNWYASLGKNRRYPTKKYLEEAITSYCSKNMSGIPDYIHPVGCYILSR